ncbi:hypothetical protein [Lewinella sp. W8]|uniref:hypothetical protein n=1 Tax=Lewinella sp. W8 TaxID=2528208 RepID=UPI001067C5E8|nr:hypothetical protein [Lewinella sp. W8]MTB51211.1 hypothetical protein [Lewinella sp. W8]
MEFRESQKFNQWWLWLIMIGVLGFTAWAGWKAFLEQGDLMPGIVGVGVTAIISILLALIELRTTITEDGIEARFWPFGRKRIFRSEIESAEVRSYSPIGEFGGWGYRIGPGGIAFNMQGNRGLQLKLKNGSKILIGTQKPEELSAFMKEFMGEVDDDEIVRLRLKELAENKDELKR